MIRLVRHCEGKPAATARPHLPSLNHSFTLDTKIRLSTFADVARQANFDAVDGNFLPPAYMLTYRVDETYSSLDRALDISGGNNAECVAALDNAIAALRLHQSANIGRGSVHSWTTGLGSSFGKPSPATDTTALMFIRGDDPPFVPPWSEYQLRVAELDEIKLILKHIRQTIPTDAKVEQAVRFLGTREHDWVTLYKVHEIVASDVGGMKSIITNGWITRDDQSLFTRTANNPLAAGDEARHGHQTTQPPAVPMEISKAKRLIANVIIKWLRSKNLGDGCS